MRIIDNSHPVDVQAEFSCLHVVPNAPAEPERYAVQVEHRVRVFVNGELFMSLTCSPDHIVELVVGRLLSEGFVSIASEIEEVSLSEDSSFVYVRLASALPFDDGRYVEEVGTCSTDLRPFSHLAFRTEDLPQLEPIAWTEDDIFALTRDFEADSPMHRLSFGSHSCYLAQGAEVLYCCEDLGRHNAFDKVLGCALIDGVDLGKCTIFTSGRVPTDMVAKAIRAKVPILVSKAVPTDLTLRLAREHGLTLICSAHSDSFRVFNAPGKCD